MILAEISKTFLRTKICSGCLTNDKAECEIEPLVNGFRCPCSTCLVKVMCENTCSKLYEYSQFAKRRKEDET